MTSNVLIGDAITKPFENIQRAKVDMARQAQIGEQTALMPQRLALQNRLADIRQESVNNRAAQLNQMNNYRIQLLNLRLMQLKENMDFRDRQLNLQEERLKFDEQNPRLGGGSAPIQAHNEALNQIKIFNPNLTDTQLPFAYEAYLDGQSSLPDGTPITPMNESIRGAISRDVGYTVSKPNVALDIKSEQADKEIKALTYLINQYQGQYGTIYGKSPQAIVDSLSKDPSKQKQLGQLLAANQLALDQAMIIQNLQTGKSTVAGTMEMLSHSPNRIGIVAPYISKDALQAYNDTMLESLGKVYNARASVGVGFIEPQLEKKKAEAAIANEIAQSQPSPLVTDNSSFHSVVSGLLG